MQEFKHSTIRMVIFLIALVAVTFLIIGNAVTDHDSSHQKSEAIADIFASVEQDEYSQIELFIRKAAHLIEYAALGVAVMALTVCLSERYRKMLYGFAMFFVLAVAVTDEHLQNFSGRTSSTSDIILNFIGAVIGFCMVLIITRIYRFFNRKASTKSRCNNGTITKSVQYRRNS